MKKKTVKLTRLALSKQTIAALSAESQTGVNGGSFTQDYKTLKDENCFTGKKGVDTCDILAGLSRDYTNCFGCRPQ